MTRPAVDFQRCYLRAHIEETLCWLRVLEIEDARRWRVSATNDTIGVRANRCHVYLAAWMHIR